MFVFGKKVAGAEQSLLHSALVLGRPGDSGGSPAEPKYFLSLTWPGPG